MRFILQRGQSKAGVTLSRLTLGEKFICDVLEDEVREVKGQPVAKWKVHGRTAIPAGTYEVVAQNSPRFGPDTLTLLDVPGFQYIRVHAGNSAEDTEGCLLPGLRMSETRVVSSRAALAHIRELVLPALKAGEKVQIEIRAAL
jgi:hypothetical protein